MTNTANKYTDAEIISATEDALKLSDPDQVESAYNDIVKKVITAFNNDQREVAAELQRLSKCVESARNTEDALTFKQRTCESMLKISMAERHKGRVAPPKVAVAAPKSLPFKTIDYILVGCKSFEDDVRFYKKVMGGELLWAFQKSTAKFAGIKLAYGPLMVLTDLKGTTGTEPLLTVDNLQASIDTLKASGLSKIDGPHSLPFGTTYTLADSSGNRLVLLHPENADGLERSYADSSNKSAIRFD